MATKQQYVKAIEDHLNNVAAKADARDEDYIHMMRTELNDAVRFLPDDAVVDDEMVNALNEPVNP